MTAVMLETVRKGMWDATPEQIAEIAELHTETVNEFGAACSGFVCDNAKLREFISSKVSKQAAGEYNKAVGKARAENLSADDGMVMKKDELNRTETSVNRVNGIIVVIVVLAVLVGLVVLIRRRRNNIEKSEEMPDGSADKEDD